MKVDLCDICHKDLKHERKRGSEYRCSLPRRVASMEPGHYTDPYQYDDICSVCWLAIEETIRSRQKLRKR